MDGGRLLRHARRRAGLTQRDLAKATGIAQPAIARIESSVVSPRLDTLDRLLRGCGAEIAVRDRLGIGIDRSMMRELLRLTPAERLRLAEDDARGLEALA